MVILRFYNATGDAIYIGGDNWHEFDNIDDAMQFYRDHRICIIAMGGVEASVVEHYYARVLLQFYDKNGKTVLIEDELTGLFCKCREEAVSQFIRLYDEMFAAGAFYADIISDYSGEVLRHIDIY